MSSGKRIRRNPRDNKYKVSTLPENCSLISLLVAAIADAKTRIVKGNANLVNPGPSSTNEFENEYRISQGDTAINNPKDKVVFQRQKMFDWTNSQITYGISIIKRGPQKMIPCVSPVCIGLGYKPETEVSKCIK